MTPTRFDVDHTATSGLEVQVTAGAGCTWSAISHDTWVAVTAGASGSGSGPVVFDVSAEVLGGRRVGTLTIAGTTVEVRQERWRLFP